LLHHRTKVLDRQFDARNVIAGLSPVRHRAAATHTPVITGPRRRRVTRLRGRSPFGEAKAR
jgi:hypothetical protein